LDRRSDFHHGLALKQNKRKQTKYQMMPRSSSPLLDVDGAHPPPSSSSSSSSSSVGVAVVVFFLIVSSLMVFFFFFSDDDKKTPGNTNRYFPRCVMVEASGPTAVRIKWMSLPEHCRNFLLWLLLLLLLFKKEEEDEEEDED